MPAKELKHLLLLSLDDARSPTAWSGIPFSLREALEKRIPRVTVVTRFKPKRTVLHGAIRLALAGRPPRYPLFMTPPAQKEFARIAESAIRECRPDAVLAVSSHFLAEMEEIHVPTFMLSDAPWITYKQLYGSFEPMPLLGRRFAQREAEAARRCTGVILASQWAAREAAREYGVPSAKVYAQPFGANLTPRISGPELHALIDQRPTDRIDLLFVGKDWERKGGPFALEIAAELRNVGMGKIQLHIVGCRPEIPSHLQDLVQVHGLLRTSDPAHRNRLESVFLRSHFLVVPTMAECFGLVFAEAQAFGLPPVSRAIQAIPEIVLDGQSGLLGAADASAASYARRIADLYSAPVRYRAMAQRARQRYENLLNWDRFADRFVALVQEGPAGSEFGGTAHAAVDHLSPNWRVLSSAKSVRSVVGKTGQEKE